jgi:TIR domain
MLEVPDMPTGMRYLFVSYARQDFDRIRGIVDATRQALLMRGVPVELWMDLTNLTPGELWSDAISKALEAAIGLLFFVSRRSLRSDWGLRGITVTLGLR